MPFGTAYQFIKDLISFAKVKEIDPIDPGTSDAYEIAAMGLIDPKDIERCSWVAHRNLYARTGGSNATHEIVWKPDRRHRTKQRIVRFRHDGNLDCILIRKKGAKT
jgi:hypothetical protein